MKKKKFKNNSNNTKFKEKLDILQYSISTFSNKVPLYNIFPNADFVDTHSLYDMSVYDVNIIDNNKYTFSLDEVEIPDKLYRCNKVVLLPTSQQSKLLLNMMDGYRIVYNITIKFIKARDFEYKQQQKNIINVPKPILSKEEKEQIKLDKKAISEKKKKMTKEELIEENRKKRVEKINRLKSDNNNEMTLDPKIICTYFLKDKIAEISNKYKTPIHTLNQAVKLACVSFKSAMTNFRNGNIKSYRIREIKKDKDSLIMDIEKSAFSKNGLTIVSSVLGKKLLNKSNLKYNEIKNDCKIHYNKNTKKFILLVPQIVERETNNKESYISIDPGLRTFLNCKTNNSYIEIWNNLRDNLKKGIEKIDFFSNKKNGKQRKRYTRISKEKVKNQVKDTHNKIINYLTKTYKTIIIGKWSTKSIISKENSILSKMDKRIINTLSFYQFLEKLKQKCLERDVDLKMVEEHYTSKVCTCCGNKKDDLGGNTEYKCTNCKIKIKRDYNGSRNIFLKSLKEIN